MGEAGFEPAPSAFGRVRRLAWPHHTSVMCVYHSAIPPLKIVVVVIGLMRSVGVEPTTKRLRVLFLNVVWGVDQSPTNRSRSALSWLCFGSADWI